MLHIVLLAAALAAPPSPSDYYARAIAAMNALPQPAYAAFRLDLSARGAGILANCSGGQSALVVGWGAHMQRRINLGGDYRLRDNAAALVEPDGTYCNDQLALFKPSWLSIHDWLRYGLFDSPMRSASATAPASVAPAAGTLHTIASVVALAPAAYDITDMGGAACPGGSAGHALHLIARWNPDAHPLMDVVIDQKSMLFCAMRFRLFSSTFAGTGAKGDILLSLGQSGPFWMLTGAHAVMSARLLGASFKSISFDVAYKDMQYPADLPATMFGTPKR